MLDRTYIELELSLGAIERVRTLYQKFLEWAPAHCGAWTKFSELERSLGELDRARSIYELAIAQPLLDMPEVLWKVRSMPGSRACLRHPIMKLRTAPAGHFKVRLHQHAPSRLCWSLAQRMGVFTAFLVEVQIAPSSGVAIMRIPRQHDRCLCVGSPDHAQPAA